MSAKPTILIAHGAWQSAITFADFADQLEVQGHKTEVVFLPSVDEDSLPVPGLREDCESLANALSYYADQGDEIILLCHSYGGVVGSCAVEGQDIAYRRKKLGKRGGVIMVIYMSAFMLPKGTSFFEMLGGQTLFWMNIQGEKVYPVASMMNEIMFNDLSLERAAIHAQRLRHGSTAALDTPSTYEPWSNGIPCAYIFCEMDGVVPLRVQQMMARQLGPELSTFNLMAGHCSFLSVPEQVIEIISEASEVALSKRIF